MTEQQIQDCQQRFVQLLGTIEGSARQMLARVHLGGDHEENVAEALAIAWSEWRRITEQGADPCSLARVLGKRAAIAVLRGARLASVRRAAGFTTDTRERRRRARTTPGSSPQSAPWAQAAFKIDFPAWVGIWRQDRQEAILLLSQGYGTGEVAQLLGTDSTEICKWRRRFARSWQAYTS